MTADQARYPLGSDPVELDRLNQQGAVLAPATRMILTAAGIGPGMRVLDLGTGTGDVTFIVADLVGPGGEVVGVDRSTEALAVAQARARHRGLSNIHFVHGDLHDPVAVPAPFDAIVTRLVLMYLPDASTVLRTQVTLLRPGGLVVPIEIDVHSGRTVPALPLFERALWWLAEAFSRSGADPALGPRLWSTLLDAGVRPLGMVGVQPYFGPDDRAGPMVIAGIVRAALPLIERTGVATAEAVEIDTLQHRLASELSTATGVLAHPMLIGVWGEPATAP
jgi:SAM-dependent methyltransferase